MSTYAQDGLTAPLAIVFPKQDVPAADGSLQFIDEHDWLAPLVAQRHDDPPLPFTYRVGGKTSPSGILTLNWQPVPLGRYWKVERLAISLDGLSSSARSSLYLTDSASEFDLLDYANSASGSSPSRVTLAPAFAYFIDQGQAITLTIASAAATINAFALAQGVQTTRHW